MDTSNPSNTLSDFDGFISKFSPFIHEIRTRAIITLVVFALAAGVGFLFYENILRFLIELFSLKGVNVVFTTPFQFINLAFSCGIATGLVLTFPLIVFQIMSFIKPALKPREFNLVVKFLPFSLILFISGFVFGVMIMRWQIELFLSKAVSLGIGNFLDVSHLLGTVMLVASVMGLAFQFPIVLFLLMRLGLLKRGFLAKQRLWVYLGSLIFAILLPIDSVVADFLLSLPLIGLFELTLVLDRVF